MCQFCDEIYNENDYKCFGEVQGNEIVKMNDGDFAIYLCEFFREYILMRNVKFCPYCSKDLFVDEYNRRLYENGNGLR